MAEQTVKSLAELVLNLPEVGAPVLKEARSLDARRRELKHQLAELELEQQYFVESLEKHWNQDEIRSAGIGSQE